MAAPPLTPVPSCAIVPQPHNWAAVPPEDHERLNAVPIFWNKHNEPMDTCELIIHDTAGTYELQIGLAPGDVVIADMLERLASLRHVDGVECNTNVRGTRSRGAVCVFVRSTARDYATGGMPAAADVAAPLGGTSYTQVLRASCAPQIASLCAAVRATRK
jgi:hypothetical protein